MPDSLADLAAAGPNAAPPESDPAPEDDLTQPSEPAGDDSPPASPEPTAEGDSREGEPPAPESPDTPSPEDAARDHLIAKVKERTGIDLAGKYDDLDAILDGLGNAARLVDQRNQAAQQWQALVDRYGEEGAVALLQKQQAAAEPSKDDGGLPDFDAYEQLAAEAQANPTSAAARRYAKIQESIQRGLYEAVRKQGQVDAMLDKFSKGSLVTAEQAQQQQRAAAETAWTREHAADLYVDGIPPDTPGFKGLSPLAQTVVEMHLVREGDGIPEWENAMRVAKSVLEAKQPKPSGTRPASPKAKRSPAVAAPPGKQTAEQVMEQLEKELKQQSFSTDGLLAAAAAANQQG